MNRRQEAVVVVCGAILTAACLWRGVTTDSFLLTFVVPVMLIGMLTFMSLRTRTDGPPKIRGVSVIAVAIVAAAAVNAVVIEEAVGSIDFFFEKLAFETGQVATSVNDLRQTVEGR